MVSRYSGAPLSDAELTKACGPRHEGRFAGARATLRSWGDATDGARGDALSGDSRERETASSEFRPLRLGGSRFRCAVRPILRELFGFWADFRSVRLWAGRWLAARGAAELFVVLFVSLPWIGGGKSGRGWQITPPTGGRLLPFTPFSTVEKVLQWWMAVLRIRSRSRRCQTSLSSESSTRTRGRSTLRESHRPWHASKMSLVRTGCMVARRSATGQTTSGRAWTWLQ